MKKLVCLIFVALLAMFFSGCANMQGIMQKIVVCDDECKPDADKDGVPDCRDECPDTPKGVAVCAKGCPLDTDGDGVLDYLDKGPNTPKGAKVNSDGCWVLAGVNFDTDKSIIKPAFTAKLDEVADVLNKNSGLKVEIQGHTDNVASAAYNQKLSESRAAAVKAYLVDKRIAADRMIAKGFGLTNPAVQNDTKEGRAQNRRVVLKPIK